MQICHALLQDRCSVVSGVSGVSGVSAGLGRKLALQCAQHGAKVVLGARSPGFLNDVATEIAHAGGDAIAVPWM
jgi:short-subunit dehydrogenase